MAITDRNAFAGKRFVLLEHHKVIADLVVFQQTTNAQVVGNDQLPFPVFLDKLNGVIHSFIITLHQIVDHRSEVYKDIDSIHDLSPCLVLIGCGKRNGI